MLRSKNLLRGALMANAALSLASGLALAVAPETLAGLLGPAVPANLMLGLGVLFLIFGADVAFVARREEPKLAQAGLITALDAVWVVASLAVLAVFSGQLSTLGFWLVAVQALIVADFAILQFLGIRQRTRGADALAAA